MVQHIMVATDFSERSDRALRRATLIAKEAGAALSLVHVVDDDQPQRIIDAERDTALTLLHEQTATVARVDGVPSRAHVVLGTAFSGIVQAVARERPDLLVIGPYRRRALRDTFVGTTAERTVRQVSCPVLMVNAPPVGTYRHMLMTTDLSAGSRAALEMASGLGIAPHAQRSLLLAFDAPVLRLAMSYTISSEEKEAYLETERAQAVRNLAGFLSGLSTTQCDRVLRHARTTPANEILAAADELVADLIVVGTRGASGFTRLLLGSVAEEVLRRARRDVLAVPPVRARG